MLDKGKYTAAIYQLENIRKRADSSVDGTRMDDWITDPNSQENICTMIDALVSYTRIQ